MKWIDAHCHVGLGLMNGMEEHQLLEQMDRYGIETAVVAPWDQAVAVHNREGNDYVRRLTEKHPDRLAAFCTVNPWFGQQALDELERCAKSGMSGLKLHPVYQGFQLTDPFILPLIEKAVDFGLPIYIATGTPVSSLPMALSYVADLFPEGTFIQGHFGFPDFWIDAVPSVRKSSNIYIDTAYNMLSSIENAIRLFGAERVLFSTDSPYLSIRHETRKLLDLDITEEQRRLIGRDNMWKHLSKGGR